MSKLFNKLGFFALAAFSRGVLQIWLSRMHGDLRGQKKAPPDGRRRFASLRLGFVRTGSGRLR
jgi:hypothetical protein